MPATSAAPARTPAAVAPRHPREVERLGLLRWSGLLDSPPEKFFDDAVAVAAELCGTPIAVLTLVEETRQWFKAAVGLDVPETPIEASFCAHAVGGDLDLLVVPDATADRRFADNPLVAVDGGIRFYAGATVRTGDGLPLGTLCVLDAVPRVASEGQLRALRALADVVAERLRSQLDARTVPVPRDAGHEAARADLARGLRCGELVTHLQPLYAVPDAVRGDAVPVGAEALVRWQHPTRGLLLPGAFLPLAEESGLVAQVGAAVLEQSLSWVARTDAEGLLPPGFAVHVNFSPRELHTGTVCDLVCGVLARTGADPARVVLEVTETALLDSARFSPSDADELVDLGVALALDDFGTGYASLAQLRRYPFSGLKIDRSFVAGLGSDEQDTVIVGSVVRLGQDLGLTVVAEGVETPDQLAALDALGCCRAQGFLLGRPGPAEQLTEELRRSAGR